MSVAYGPRVLHQKTCSLCSSALGEAPSGGLPPDDRLDDYLTSYLVPDCGHEFHVACMSRQAYQCAVHRKPLQCPQCQKPVPPEDAAEMRRDAELASIFLLYAGSTDDSTKCELAQALSQALRQRGRRLGRATPPASVEDLVGDYAPPKPRAEAFSEMLDAISEFEGLPRQAPKDT
jgi:hypothetical protein